MKWRPMLGNEDCADLPVNTPEQGSEEWVKPRISNETSTHFIEEIEDEEEWKNSLTNSFSNIEDFNEITIRYIGMDDSLSDIWNSACSEDNIEEKWINATLSPSQEFAIKQDEGKKKQTTEEIVPLEYHEYLDVFQEEVERFPKARSWDHAIDMKPGFEPRSFKSYNLTPEEREQQELFIMENMKKGYIRLSKSPMASPFFFVSKKDG